MPAASNNPSAFAPTSLQPWFQRRSNYILNYSRHTLAVPNLPRSLQGLHITHVSDLHMTEDWVPAYDELQARLQEARRPHLILFTGDLLEDKHDPSPEALENARRLLNSFDAPLGVYAIMGNHDTDLLAPFFASLKPTFIDGRVATLTVDGATIEIIGLRGTLRELPLPAVPSRSDNSLRIVLSHFPDRIRRVTDWKPDLFFAGHTHGGQICLPGGRPLITHDSLPREMVSGVHRLDGCWLVVSRGVGFSKLPCRLFCPAEIVDVTLSCGSSPGSPEEAARSDPSSG